MAGVDVDVSTIIDRIRTRVACLDAVGEWPFMSSRHSARSHVYARVVVSFNFGTFRKPCCISISLFLF